MGKHRFHLGDRVEITTPMIMAHRGAQGIIDRLETVTINGKPETMATVQLTGKGWTKLPTWRLTPIKPSNRKARKEARS